jgi:hypothetical protein
VHSTNNSFPLTIKPTLHKNQTLFHQAHLNMPNDIETLTPEKLLQLQSQDPKCKALYFVDTPSDDTTNPKQQELWLDGDDLCDKLDLLLKYKVDVIALSFVSITNWESMKQKIQEIYAKRGPETRIRVCHKYCSVTIWLWWLYDSGMYGENVNIDLGEVNMDLADFPNMVAERSMAYLFDRQRFEPC